MVFPQNQEMRGHRLHPEGERFAYPRRSANIQPRPNKTRMQKA